MSNSAQNQVWIGGRVASATGFVRVLGVATGTTLTITGSA